MAPSGLETGMLHTTAASETCIERSPLSGFAIARVSFNTLKWRMEVWVSVFYAQWLCQLVSQGLSQRQGLLWSEKVV